MKLSLPSYTPKKWGYELCHFSNELFTGKTLHLLRGHACSLHVHFLKSETFYVRKGLVKLEWIDLEQDLELLRNGSIELDKEALLRRFNMYAKIDDLKSGESFYVPPGRAHRFFGTQTSEIIEFSTQHLDSDSYRFTESY